MIRIAIADDQVLFRDMLQILLSQDPSFEVVGCAGDGNGILRICAEDNPDVVLLDVRMPKADGIFALMQIKESYPRMKVIMLTTFEEEETIFKACTGAADGYILKDMKPEALILAVKCVQAGLFVLHKSVQSYMARQLRNVSPANDKLEMAETMIQFDQTDLAILKNLCMGRNNSEIAQSVNYSEGTVKNRISRMLEVAQLKDRTQLAIYALQNGIV